MKRTGRYRKAREYLERVQKADNRAEKLEMRMENLRVLATDTANHLNGGLRAGKRTGTGSEASRRRSRIRSGRSRRHEVRETVSQIREPMCQKVIMMHYLEYRTLQEIAEEICYSRTQTFRLLETGREEIERMLANE